jgi:pimeloyl-ACP methyl ester carboxylesterase/ubiquinone/menaquinone biosynthesis C-methylase UbiE
MATPRTPSIRDRAAPHAAVDVRRKLLDDLPVTERRYTLAGIDTAVLEGGEGPPLVLLHGPGDHAPKWLRVLPDLVAAHRVVAPDLPGHGASAAADAPLDADRVLAWLDALIERTCATAPALVGHIHGGAIAARFAARHGDRIRCLVLVDTLGLVPFSPTPEFGRVLGEFVAAPSEDTHDRQWERCSFDYEALRKGLGERWDWMKAYNLAGMTTPALRPTQQALMETFGLPPMPVDELARITAPTAMIWGRHDLATPLPVAEAAAQRFGWPLHVIDAAADDPAMDQPAAFVRVLRGVLADAARRPWDGVAAGYAAHVTPLHAGVAEEGLRRAGLRAGARLLDVAAGSGALAIPAARQGARVLATDASPAMVRLLRERAAAQGLHIDTAVMDGQALELPDGAFDIVASQFGVMLFLDMPKGLREMVRVARRGGRVLVNALGDPRRIEFLGFFARAVQSVRPGFSGPPTDPPPLEFQLADPKRLSSELAAAGLGQVIVETVTETLSFDTGRALWDWLVSSNPIVERMLAGQGVTAAEREKIVQALEGLVRDRAAGAPPAQLTVPVNVGVGVK